MGRPRKNPIEGAEAQTSNELALDLLNRLNKKATGSAAALQGDLAVNTYGIKIPHLAFQWLIGGSDVIPTQRYMTFSGLPKSFKSTLNIEIGNWFISQGGLHVQIDTENKTSPTMLDSMAWMHPSELVAKMRHRVFKPTDSNEEWMTQLVEVVKYGRETAIQPKGSRVPIFVSVDSLSGSTNEDNIETLMKEGSAQARGFPVDAMQVTNYLKALKLHDTLINVGVVQHLTQDLSDAGGYGGPKFKEKGAAAMKYGTSVGIRVSKMMGIESAGHSSAMVEGPPVEGYTLQLSTAVSCVGPDGNKLEVDVLWQYVKQEDGTRRQVMWYDWHGALGKLLWQRKYDDKRRVCSYEQDELDQAVKFTQPKAKRIKSEELGLESATFSEFGKAIENNPVVRDKVQKYLCIKSHPNVQEMDLDFKSQDNE